MKPLPMLRLLAGLAVAAALGGCSTLRYGTDDSVAVVTDPPGASVVSSTGTICVSPCRVVGARKDGFSLTIAKPGYVTQSVGSESKLKAGSEQALRNEYSADYLGRVIDAQDGSLNEHVPPAIVVKLDKAS